MPRRRPRRSPRRRPTRRRCPPRRRRATRRRHPRVPSASPSPSASPTPPPQLKVISVSPRAKAGNVSFASSIRVRFSAALATGTPLPKLTPKVPGAWKIVKGSTLQFVPKGHLPIYTKVHLAVPGGSAGVLAADGARLHAHLRAGVHGRRSLVDAASSAVPRRAGVPAAALRASRDEADDGQRRPDDAQEDLRVGHEPRAPQPGPRLAQAAVGRLRLALPPHPLCAGRAVAAAQVHDHDQGRRHGLRIRPQARRRRRRRAQRVERPAQVDRPAPGQQARLRLHRGLDLAARDAAGLAERPRSSSAARPTPASPSARRPTAPSPSTPAICRRR